MKFKKIRRIPIVAFLSLVGITACVPFVPGVYSADTVKIGFLGGFTGPIESLTPGILKGVQVAADSVNAAGGVLDGSSLEIVEADTTCTDASMATNGADRLVNSDQVVAIVGALCSGSTIAAANNVAIPAGVVMVSPASTSPAITVMDDNDLVFRTAPSDAYQGQSMAKLLTSKGINNIAITYVNNDYGKGFADALSAAFSGMGGTVSANEAHEDGKADYRAEIGSLASAGAETLVVLAYADGSGQTIIRQAVESGDFASFVGGDGMVGQSIIDGIGAEALEGMILTSPGSVAGQGKDAFEALWEGEKVVFADNAYDAAYLLALAIRKNGGAGEGLSAALRAVSSPPGIEIYPGEFAKAVEALNAGEEINYEGATGSHDFDDAGDVAGLINESAVQGGAIVEIGVIM